MKESEYSVYCDFDPVKHKARYVNYLEVIILETGKIVYAVPSHQMKLEELCCQKLRVSREQFIHMCPEDKMYDYLDWLMETCGAISVWTDFYAGTPNAAQHRALERLKIYGLFKGTVMPLR